MKEEKGFTLIELLAVILILGIITIVAVPKILDVINKSRDSAVNSSLKLVKDAIKTQIASSDLTGPVFTKETDGCYVFNFDDQTTGNSKELSIKNKDRVSGSIKYCNNTFSDDTLKFNGSSISKDDTNKNVICKRATILHTEECTQTDGYCAESGYTENGTKGTSTITYGNLGTSGTLTSGDAFDCDVDGTGFNKRFYYVSDLDTNSDAVVLIYSHNTLKGEDDDSTNTGVAYDSNSSYVYGPRTASANLPTKEQWSKISLVEPNRTIVGLSSSGTYSNVGSFDYSNYSARLITISEIEKACDIKVSGNSRCTANKHELTNKCLYLLDNTNFSGTVTKTGGYLTETPRPEKNNVWNVSAWSSQCVNDWGIGDNSFSVRPAIEVLKKNINY